MKIIIIAVGKEKDFAGYELVAEYTSRIAHYAPIEWVYIPASHKDEEGKRVLKALDLYERGGTCHVVVLDETGKEFDSRELASFVGVRMNEGVKSLVFIIGGSYGVDEGVRVQSQTTIALSRLTFPHQLVRLIVAEQIYRAFTILKGEKYHH